jgi:hypothetical protein
MKTRRKEMNGKLEISYSYGVEREVLDGIININGLKERFCISFDTEPSKETIYEIIEGLIYNMVFKEERK